MIKNTTPYIGKIRLKFEKFPYYTGKSKLNKVHLDLGFTKLVSRITPKRDMEGWLVNPESKYLIEKYTDGVITGHTFGDNNEYSLPNSFMTKDGGYVGDVERGWWSNRQENEQAWKVSAADIANNNYNLDIKNPNAPVEVHDDPEELFNLYRIAQQEVLELQQKLRDLLGESLS